MDPFELLKKDHRTVSKLFDRIEAASGKAKLGVFKQIKSELDLHTHIEEAIFYPAIEKANETRALTLEAYEEHKVVKKLLAELDSANSVSDEWKAKLDVLRENVEHHVKEEENELFDKANDVLTGDEAERLGDRMRAEKVKQGGSAPEPDRAREEPGLLQKIANTLGIGTAPQRSNKSASKKKTTKAIARKKTATKAKAAKKTGPAGKPKVSKAVKSPGGSAGKRVASKKKGTSKAAGGRKKTAAKK